MTVQVHLKEQVEHSLLKSEARTDIEFDAHGPATDIADLKLPLHYFH